VNLLLDTHAFLWFITGDAALSKKARLVIEDNANQVFLSTASLWEIAIKVSLGKIRLNRAFEELISEQLAENGIQLLDISVAHTALVASMLSTS